MHYNKFIAAIVIGVGLVLATAFELPSLGVIHASKESQWIARMYQAKDLTVACAASPRILVVGGSSALFGLDTQVLTDRYQVPVINYGGHAGLGIEYLLYRAQRALGSGDLVILIVELGVLQEKPAPTIITQNFARFYDQAYISTKPLLERVPYLVGYGLTGSIWTELAPERGRTDITFDQLGNARGNTVAASQTAPVLLHTPIPKALADPGTIDALRRFADNGRNAGVAIIAVPSPIYEVDAYNSAEYEPTFDDVPRAFKQAGIAYLGAPELGFLPIRSIYDTIYHANDVGRADYTKRMISLLAPMVEEWKSHRAQGSVTISRPSACVGRP